MKKVLIGLTALTMATSVMAAGRTVIETRVGGSFAGAYKSESDSPWDKKTSGMGYEVAVEGMQEVTEDFFLGMGVAYQDHAKSKDAITSMTSKTTGMKVTTNPEGSQGGKDKIATVSQDILIDTDKAQLFKSVPVYLTAKYQFNTDSAFKPFVKANFGYSFNLKGDEIMNKKQSMENGLYYAVGAGIDYNNFVVDLAYQVNQGKVKSEAGKLKADHSRVTLGLGYRFDL